MKRIFFSLLCLSIFSVKGTAQELFQFQSNPTLHEVPEAYKKESAVYLMSNRKVQYRVITEKDKVFIKNIFTMHYIVKVLDEKGIASFNTIHLPKREEVKYTTMKAQCLTATAKRIEITEDKIRTQKDEDGNMEYYIAFEGVDIGSEIEVLIQSERFTTSFEGQLSYSQSFPIINANFQLEVPEHLVFEVKGYNGFSEVQTDTTEESVKHTVSLQNSKPLPDELYSNSFYMEPRVAYRLSYIPNSNGSVRYNSWNDFAQKMNEIYMQAPDKKDAKSIEQFLKANGITDKLSEKEKIIKIEEAIKNKIAVTDDLNSTPTLRELLSNKSGNSFMITKLYNACFSIMNIDYTMGLTSNRYEHQLDNDFELWNQLDIFIFKFNNLDGYLMPQNIVMRYPLLPLPLYGNKVLYCKVRTLGGISTATAQIEKIDPIAAEKNNSEMTIDVSFDKSTLEPTVTTSTAHHGVSSIIYRPLFAFNDVKKHKEILMDLASIKEKEENIKAYDIKNYKLANISDEKPIVISTTIVSPQWMSKAGNTLLFKVGEVIGPQQEMYEVKEKRVMPIDIQYPHHLVRKITIDLIPGYKIKNMDDLVIDKQFGKYGFVSSYKKENNKLIVDIDEYYTELELPKSEIDNFRSVINAAADFNKVTLVFEKE